jgi:hypothetical protein
MMDSGAFLPVRAEELTNLEVPQRLLGLANLIPDLTASAVAAKIADTRGLSTGHQYHCTGRYVWICPSGNLRAQVWLGVDHKEWSGHGITPLWIRFDDSPQSRRAPFVLQALKEWGWTPLFQDNGRALIPLTVLPGVAREEVLKDLLDQLKRLHAELQSATAVTITEP